MWGIMTEKRFERIYADVDVFCRDHNAKGESQLIEREDYDRIVDLLNDLSAENEELKQENKKLQGEYDHLLWLYNGLGCEYDWLKDENMELKHLNEFLKRRCDEYWEETGLNSDYFE